MISNGFLHFKSGPKMSFFMLIFKVGLDKVKNITPQVEGIKILINLVKMKY